MKKIIIYASIHHQNTEKIAKAIHSELGGRLVKFSEVTKEEILQADLIGFGSGIYLGKFHKGILKLVEDLPKIDDKKSFIFSTAGMRKNILLNRGHSSMKKILTRKGFEIIGEFDCLGYDTYGPLKLIGGVNRGRPSDKDIKKAKLFGQKIAGDQP